VAAAHSSRLARLQTTEANKPRIQPSPPRWVWWTLVVGAVILLLWSWFLLGFLSEPSAAGRSRDILYSVSGFSIATAVLSAVAAYGLRRDVWWARRLGLVASVLMVLSCAGAIAGIPAVFGLVAGRNSSTP
jgi:hypothetical protein